MKEQQTFENSATPSVHSSEPRFDDERTLLTARRVVPLRQVDEVLKRRRRWFLGGAFAVAMLLGAATAVIPAYFRTRWAPEPGVSQIEVPTSTVSEQTLTTVLPELEEEPVKVATPRRAATTPRRVTRSTNDSYTPQRGLSEDEELRRIRDAILIDEWQERRLRRVEKRERPRAQHHQRDLSNIDEIFEGVRRP